jgi:hypothetical protein
MIHQRSLVFLLLGALWGCSGTGTKDAASDAVAEPQAAVNQPPGPAAPPPGPAAADDMVTVVCQTKFYVVGVAEDDDLELLRKADSKRAWDVTGIVLEVVRPPEYAGQIITMHHDSYLARATRSVCGRREGGTSSGSVSRALGISTLPCAVSAERVRW